METCYVSVYFFTDEEQALVIDTHDLLKTEMSKMGIGS